MNDCPGALPQAAPDRPKKTANKAVAPLDAMKQTANTGGDEEARMLCDVTDSLLRAVDSPDSVYVPPPDKKFKPKKKTIMHQSNTTQDLSMPSEASELISGSPDTVYVPPPQDKKYRDRKLRTRLTEARKDSAAQFHQ